MTICKKNILFLATLGLGIGSFQATFANSKDMRAPKNSTSQELALQKNSTAQDKYQLSRTEAFTVAGFLSALALLLYKAYAECPQQAEIAPVYPPASDLGSASSMTQFSNPPFPTDPSVQWQQTASNVWTPISSGYPFPTPSAPPYPY
jgi:hypothetical protein